MITAQDPDREHETQILEIKTQEILHESRCVYAVAFYVCPISGEHRCFKGKHFREVVARARIDFLRRYPELVVGE